MIKEIKIHNYKSVKDLSLQLGRVNVFIGANGSGKSNILESIAFGAAAAKDKLDNEFLINRGIRVTDPFFMRSAFSQKDLNKEISISFSNEKGKRAVFNLVNENTEYSKWKEIIRISDGAEFPKDDLIKKLELILNSETIDEKFSEKTASMLKLIRENYSGSEMCKNFEDFLIYSPENSYLRNFEKEGQIEPLGRKGEGVFRLFKTYFSDEKKERINELMKNLSLFEWFEDINIPSNLFGNENRIAVSDKYLFNKINERIDQRSMSEGFLFILFYTLLITSEKTPSFFAIENIENALNPKMCAKLTKNIVELSKTYQKQIILTTHNPAILDGLNLDDPEQKLFVIYRNTEGHTILRNIEKPNPIEGQKVVKLSDAFLRGYLGGLPNNFQI